MKKAYEIAKRYPLTTVCIAAIWYLSFFTPPHTELDNVKFIDKWAHILMYGGTCTVLWLEHLLRNGYKAITWNAAALGWTAPILMSGAIELLQAYCTGGRRSGDWLDFAANAVGVSIALAIGVAVSTLRPRNGKDA